VGCVIAELMLTMPIFPGDSGVDQIVEIIKILGTPSREDILTMNPNYNEFRFPHINPIPWDKVFKPNTQTEAIRFVSSLLVYNPAKRPNPLLALQDRYFDEIRDSATRLPSGLSVPSSLFQFNEEEKKYAAKIGHPDLI
jgi:glycogen synthase kinase 3 beta